MLTLCATLEQEVAIVAVSIPTLKSFKHKSLLAIGRYLYDEETKSQTRIKLAAFGFLDACCSGILTRSGTEVGREFTRSNIHMATLDVQ